MNYEEHLHGIDASHQVDRGDQEEHHETKPALKKVKDKVKKINNTITRKTHAHSDDDGEDDDHDDQVVGTDPEVHGAPMYDTTSTTTTRPEAPANQDQQQVAQAANLKNIKGTIEEDPAVPKPRGDQDPSSPYPPYAGPYGEGRPYGGNEMLSSSLEGMTLSDEKREEEETDRVVEKEPGYSDKIGSAAAAAAKEAEQQKDRVVTVRGYLAEKLKPGEEDRALSEVISEAVQGRRKEEVEEGGGRGGGMGMVEKIRGAVTSLVGRGGGGGGSPAGGEKGRGTCVVERDDQRREPRRDEVIE